MRSGIGSASIEEIELPDGALKLRQPGRVVEPAAQQRAPARIITMVWGDRYIADLLAMTIPALLAPGNLPAFVRDFDSELVIVTETRLFDLVSRSPAIAGVLRHCDVRLVPVDDLLSSWYGITLTYALVRGFADLGPKMVETHLVFLNADFIVADGSYATLAQRILGGERLVVSPSYCMVQEETIGQLRERRDPATQALAIPRRELAAMIIAHRHNTIRAKTVNQQLFRIHRYDQFYWYVDDRSLLCRQMPIAVVYMRPERVLTEMPTFWDYGVISEYCPTTAPCVLGDSDDFLMAELRTEGTFAELLHLGWPDADEIAADLSSFTTKDHHDYGRHTLVLHSADPPAALEEGKAALGAFVDQVYARLAPPISYLDHPFWAPAFPRFLAAHIAQRKEGEERRQALAALLREEPEAAARHHRASMLRGRIREVVAAHLAIEAGTTADRHKSEGEIAKLERDYRSRRQALEAASASGTAAARAEARASANELAELETELTRLAAEEERAIVVRRGFSPAAADDPVSTAAIKAAAAPTSARLARWYRRLFGQLPHTTEWHPYHTVLRPARAAITREGEDGDILLISSGGTLGPLLVRDAKARKVAITPRMAATGLYRDMIGEQPKFGLCVCDLAFDDLMALRELLDKIRPLLAEHGRIVVFHHNNAGRALDASTYGFTRSTFPLFGRSRISFAGSWPGRFAARRFESTLNRAASRWQLVILALTLGFCAPFARLAARIEKRRTPQQLPRCCTSMTIEIDV
jgi:hypothetical protein